MAVFSYSSKLKRGLGLAFGSHFLHDFTIILSIEEITMSYLFPSQDIKQNVILSSY